MAQKGANLVEVARVCTFAVLLCCDSCKYPFQRIRQLPFFLRACQVGVKGDWG